MAAEDEHAYLWTTEREQWVILQTDDGPIPFNRVTNTALLIDENEELDAVARRMIAEGLPQTGSDGP